MSHGLLSRPPLGAMRVLSEDELMREEMRRAAERVDVMNREGVIRAPRGMFEHLDPSPYDSGIPALMTPEAKSQRYLEQHMGLGPENIVRGGGLLGRGVGFLGMLGKAKGKGFTAYHGSPHSFKKFSTGKIGTGEGAGAYGHGLYFAGAEDVARVYQDTLTKVPADYTINGKSVAGMYQRAMSTFDDEIAEVLERVQTHVKPSELKNLYTQATGYSKRTEDFVRGINYRTLRAVDADGKNIPIGRTYKVRIRADKDDLLDWDKTLGNQPKNVKAALNPLLDGAKWEKLPWPQTDYALKKGSKVLLWRPRPVDIDSLDAPTLYSVIVGGKKASDASATLKKLGIPGIKYLDQFSRGAKKGTSNFVIFDDKIIDILKKYGLAGIIAGGGLLGAASPEGAAP
jgi:hypothetical protein